MRRWTLYFLLLGAPSWGAEPPYLVEIRVRDDLHSLLSRLIPPEQFLLQVSSEVSVRTGRRITDGETFLDGVEPSKKDPSDPLPGFVQEMDEEEPDPRAKRVRESYTTIEIPKLSILRVDVSFDNALSAEIVEEAKRVTKGYLLARYPDETRLSYSLLAMRKTQALQAKEARTEDPWVKYLPWIALFGLGAWLLLKDRLRRPDPRDAGYTAYPFPPQAQASSSSAPPSASKEEIFRVSRQRFLDKVIRHNESFRLYYQRLSQEMKSEIESSLQGPALDSVIEDLGIDRAGATQPPDPQQIDSMLWHEKRFDEFVRATEWQDQRLFGFLQRISRERLIAVATFESDLNVALMLRFLPPGQSALILDSLSPDRRQKVLVFMTQVNRMDLAEISGIEMRIRSSLERMPGNGPGMGPKEMDYWGELMSESKHSKEILSELEKTNPEFAPGLKKYRFTLDDVSAVPKNTLQKAVNDVDNEELCLALSTCPKATQDTVLAGLSEKRAEAVRRQMPMYKDSGERGTLARARLQRRIRQAVAA